MQTFRALPLLLLVVVSLLYVAMANDIIVQGLLDRNKQYADTDHVPFPSLKEVSGRGGFMNTVIVSCVDARVQPEKFFKLRPGEAFVLKTVAGHPQNVVTDILLLDALAPLKKLVIMHHTDCGATSVTDEMIKDKLTSRLPEKKAEIESMNFGAYTDIKKSLRSDIDFIRDHPYMRKELVANTSAMIYDLKTGMVEEVIAPGEHAGAKSEL